MLEIAILICFAAIFIILTFRFPKTAKKDFVVESRSLDDKDLIEARKILAAKDEVPSVMEIENQPVDELDRYDKELSELLKSAREKIADGKYATAENLLIDAVCRDKKCSWAYEQLGVIYLAMEKNISDAAESFQMAIKLAPEGPVSWFGLGKIYFSENKFNKSIEALQRAVNLDRSNAEYQATLGKAYLEVRQYGKAAKALKRASSLDISNLEYKNLASVAEDKHREHSRASKLS
ncbi:MAG: tetratricopeptide repeat protein [Candidatus Berkelbacteria bacterium]|nr:tetratricopeptide repeat protein [Candidatus Berkelbacteria bacterium]